MTITLPHHRFPALILLMALLPAACGPAREESWNSYYYGAEQQQDNDDTYNIPSGTWGDDQTPQGMKW